jgi:phosphatidylglycerol:prolipoprotein diacylglycerol transferase
MNLSSSNQRGEQSLLTRFFGAAFLTLAFGGKPLASWRMHPLAFHLGPFTIHWYGVLVALGFLAGLWTAGRRAPLSGIAPEKILDVGPWLIVGAIVGARILYVISYWDEEFARAPITHIFMVQKGGLVYYGGLIGSSLAYIIYAVVRKLPFWRVADILAPSVALGYVFGRIGCLMNGCCFGRVCDLPWAVHFPEPHSTHGQAVHPTQIYDSLLNLLLYGVLAWLYRRKKFDGQVFGYYLVGFAITRSTVEVFRGDYSSYYAGWITPAHLLSVGILTTGLILLWILSRAGTSPGRKTGH